MQRFKLPSGRIIDLDAITMIRPVQVYATGKSCSLIVDGCATEVCNGDADVLYQAVDALVCNPTPKPVERIVDMNHIDALADALAGIAKVRDTMTAYSHTWIKDQLSRILSESGWDEMPPRPKQIAADATNMYSRPIGERPQPADEPDDTPADADADADEHGNVAGRYGSVDSILKRVSDAFLAAPSCSEVERMLNEILCDYEYRIGEDEAKS